MGRYRTLFEEGFVARAEVRQMEMEFRAAMLQLDLAELEMQILERKLADPSDE